MEKQQDLQHIIDKDNPYYQLIGTVKNRLSNVFDIQLSDHQSIPQTQFALRIYCRQNQQSHIPTFIYFYTFPISPNEYVALVRNFAQQKQLDSNIDRYQLYEPCQTANTQLIFLSYKKVLIVMPRFFIYVRYCFTYKGDIWLVGIQHPTQVKIQDKTRGRIILTVTRIKEVEGGSQISVYSQVDMSMNLKFDVAMNRGFAQIRKYLEKIYARLTISK